MLNKWIQSAALALVWSVCFVFLSLSLSCSIPPTLWLLPVCRRYAVVFFPYAGKSTLQLRGMKKSPLCFHLALYLIQLATMSPTSLCLPSLVLLCFICSVSSLFSQTIPFSPLHYIHIFFSLLLSVRRLLSVLTHEASGLILLLPAIPACTRPLEHPAVSVKGSI